MSAPYVCCIARSGRVDRGSRNAFWEGIADPYQLPTRLYCPASGWTGAVTWIGSAARQGLEWPLRLLLLRIFGKFDSVKSAAWWCGELQIRVWNPEGLNDGEEMILSKRE